MRNTKGQFVKGEHPSPATEFQKGQHWRKPAPFRDKAWLTEEYVNKKRPAAEIAAQFNVTENAILYWLHKNEIPLRSMAQIRSAKKWSLKGDKNGMYGRCGAQCPSWKGGNTPLRQKLYSSPEWEHISKKVKERDKSCRMCGSNQEMEIHHIIAFGESPELATEEGNLILLCKECHKKTLNKEHEFEGQLQKLLQEITNE